MHLSALDLRDFRAVAAAAIEPGPGMNLIVGPNAAGKTSLLESIHLLSTGRSFAATRTAPLVRHGGGPLRVVGRVVGPNGRVHRLGVERDRNGAARMRLDGAAVERVAHLAQALPVIAIHPESHEIIGGGPDERRRLLDLGLFHVEPAFQAVWRRYRRGLAQRNALLRSGADTRGFAIWDREVASAGEALDALRRGYVAELGAALAPMQGRLLGGEGEVDLVYRRGWPEGVALLEALAAERARPNERPVTGVGPHRADMGIRLDGRDVRQQVSRGQQKLLVYLLRLAQAQQMGASGRGGSVLLLDDLPAELDADRRARVVEMAGELGAQLFVTALAPDQVPQVPDAAPRVFHVEQGRVREVI